MNLVCVGIGGTGAACVETLVHLAAIGLFPDGLDVVPAVIDPDEAHPRIRGMTTFVSDYKDFRQRGAAKDCRDSTIFGTPIVKDAQFNHLRPAQQANLYQLLGLASPGARPLAYAFFSKREIGGPGTSEFANGFYGRANAGVCFFSDPQGKKSLLDAISQYLRTADDRLVVFGSVFGGTGAAGMLHVARTVRDNAKSGDVKPKVAIVMLEPYFRPDSSGADTTKLWNDPSTFLRRAGSAYRFLADLAARDNLPCEALYPLGIRTPEVFPPAWFAPDQQDNPHLFLEYLASLAARDFVLNPQERERVPMLKLRRVVLPPFVSPDHPEMTTHLDRLREVLYGAAVTYQVIENFVVPLVGRCQGADRLPGHPWIHDLTTQTKLPPAALLAHFRAATALLRPVLGHAGILPTEWRFERARDLSEEDKQRAELMSSITRGSFPPAFIPFLEHLKISEVLSNANPNAMFDDYDTRHDGGLPVRALSRWVLSAPMSLPRGEGAETAKERADYQLVQQEGPDYKDQAGNVLNLAQVTDDNFNAVDNTKRKLETLATATWVTRETGPGETSSTRPLSQRVQPPEPSEYPTIWAPALVYATRIYGADSRPDDRYIHLGLLWAALMPWKEHKEPPIFALRLGYDDRERQQMEPREQELDLRNSAKITPALRDTVRTTCPLSNYQTAVAKSWTVLFLHDSPDLAPNSSPREDEILGYFYPDTVVAPSRSLSDERADELLELGKDVASSGFGALLASRYQEAWFDVLKASGVPGADICGPRFITFLREFPHNPERRSISIDQAYSEHRIPDSAPWIQYLYSARFSA